MISSLFRSWPRSDVKVDLYALCWNEERMLPYFFLHYDRVVNRYFIFDNGSTDRSVELLKANPKVTLESFEVTGDSFVNAALRHYNECWKPSRGHADWVIVCNIDEHLYHPRLRSYLGVCKRLGISLITTEGYNMVSERFPETSRPLCETIKHGMREPHWDKPEIFDPDKISAIDFAPGRHTAAPNGEVIVPRHTRVRLLHYKYLGLDYLLLRHSELKPRLRSLDIRNEWGYQYFWDRNRNVEEYERIKAASVSVL